MVQTIRKEYSEVSGTHRKIINSVLISLAWMSPFIGYEIFFPIALLFLYRINHSIRSVAFQVIAFEVIIYLVSYPLDLICMWEPSSQYCITSFDANGSTFFYIAFWGIVGLFVLFFEAGHTLRKYGMLQTQSKLREKYNWIWNLAQVILSWFSAIFLYIFFNIFYLLFFLITNDVNILDSSSQTDLSIIFARYFKVETELYIWFINIFTVSRNLGRKSVLAIFRRPYLSLAVHARVRSPIPEGTSKSYLKKAKFARLKNKILPGWGILYLERYWTGFAVLFTFLLLLFFAAISGFYYFDYSFGTSFLQSFGLKPGVPDKEFIRYTSNPVTVSVFVIFFVMSYFFSQTLLESLLKRESEPLSERGLSFGFNNNISFSILFHLILFSILFVIPIMVTRNPPQRKSDMSKNHFQPEKLEYYFIDPEIPDEVKDLNGGVISGTETPSENEGEKVPDEELSENGKPKGYVKRIKGKKLPKTYSNYISARMRGPEMFMDYWKRAPRPYSCVVAYTITTEGEITDVVLVEASGYPDQDQLTIELIESMSPVMPPPGVNGDVRVTELFWNGSIDPDAVPTPLQKEMVLMFDGRYMEEEP